MTESTRRDVLENPGAYTADQIADAWAMTACQCRARGPMFAWAAAIADREASTARRASFTEHRSA